MVRKYTLVALILATQIPLHGMFTNTMRNTGALIGRQTARTMGPTAQKLGLTARPGLNTPFGTSCRHFSSRTGFGPRSQQSGNYSGWGERLNQLNRKYGTAARNVVGFLSLALVGQQLKNAQEKTTPEIDLAQEALKRILEDPLQKASFEGSIADPRKLAELMTSKNEQPRILLLLYAQQDKSKKALVAAGIAEIWKEIDPLERKNFFSYNASSLYHPKDPNYSDEAENLLKVLLKDVEFKELFTQEIQTKILKHEIAQIKNFKNYTSAKANNLSSLFFSLQRAGLDPQVKQNINQQLSNAQKAQEDALTAEMFTSPQAFIDIWNNPDKANFLVNSQNYNDMKPHIQTFVDNNVTTLLSITPARAQGILMLSVPFYTTNGGATYIINTLAKKIEDGTLFEEKSPIDPTNLRNLISGGGQSALVTALRGNLKSGMDKNKDMVISLAQALVTPNYQFASDYPAHDLVRTLLEPENFAVLMLSSNASSIFEAAFSPELPTTNEYGRKRLEYQENFIRAQQNENISRFKQLLQEHPEYKKLPGVQELLKKLPELASTGWFGWL